MRYVVLLIAVACIWGGGQGVYTSMKNPTPTEYDLSTITSANMPKESWLTLKNCNINLTEGAHFASAFGDGLAEEIYVPLRNSAQDSIVALVALKEKVLVDIYNIINNQKDAKSLQDKFEKYKENIFLKDREIKGVVRYGIDLDNKEWRQLAGLSPLLVKNFIIIDHGTEPSAGFSYFMLGLGIILLIIVIRKFIKK